jgi:AcrR family transcriptional regulator
MARNKDETRARLFAVATELLGERGFGSTTVDEIADRAGVAKGTVYYHFSSKVELVEALIAEGLTPLAENMRASVEGTSSAREALQALTYAELQFIREHRAFAKLVVTELWREDRVWRETLMIVREQMVTIIREQIERGIASGELRSDIDPRFAGGALFALTATAALDWLALDPERSIDEVVAQIRNLTAMAVVDPTKTE